jgi:hypothetical protein
MALSMAGKLGDHVPKTHIWLIPSEKTYFSFKITSNRYVLKRIKFASCCIF